MLAILLSYERSYQESGDKVLSLMRVSSLESIQGSVVAFYISMHLSRLNLIHPLDSKQLSSLGSNHKMPEVAVNLEAGQSLKPITFNDILTIESQPFGIEISYEPYWKKHSDRFKNPHNMMAWSEKRLLEAAYRDARSNVFKTFEKSHLDLSGLLRDIASNPILAFSFTGKSDKIALIPHDAPENLFGLFDWLHGTRNSLMDDSEAFAIFIDTIYTSIEKVRSPPMASALTAYYMKKNQIGFISKISHKRNIP